MSLKAYVLAAAAVAVVGGLTASHLWVYRAGRAAEQAAVVARIEKENDNAGRNAEDWRARLRRCLDADGVFDFETGRCDR